MAIAAERCVYTNQIFAWEIIQPDGSISGGTNWNQESPTGTKPAVGAAPAAEKTEPGNSASSSSSENDGSSSSSSGGKKGVRRRSSAGKESSES